MVFVTKPTQPIEVVHVPFTEQPANVLQFSAQYHMVGLISSLGEVSSYATDLFNSLLQETSKLNSRMASVGQRIANLQRSTIEDTLKKTPVTQFLETPRSNYALEPVQVEQQITRSSLPRAIQEKYNTISKPPPFQLVNPFMDDGKDALKQYTNPSFFLDEWIQEQLRQREEAKKARRERKKQRQEKKETQLKAAPEQAVEVTKIKVVKYDPLTGEKILVDAPSSGTIRPGITQTASKFQLSTNTVPSFDSEPPPSAPQDSGMTLRPNRNSQINDMSEAPAPPGYQPKPYAMPGVPARSVPNHANVPAPFTPAPYTPQQQQQQHPQYVDNNYRGNVPQPQMYAQPAYVPPPGPPPSYNSAPVYVQQQQAPPPPPAPDAPPPPGPPPPPTPSFHDDEPAPMSGLAAALSGAKLKSNPVENKPKTEDAKSGLLESIRAGIQLKSAKERTIVPEVEKEEVTSVASILARRIAIVGASDSEDDDDDDDWDD